MNQPKSSFQNLDEADKSNPSEVAFEEEVRRHLPRNYAAHFLHGMFGMTGFRLVNAPTFLPAYIYMLSGSELIVGISQSLRTIGGAISPIIGASKIESREKVLPVALLMGTLMRLQILGIALAGWLLEGWWLIGAIMFFLFLMGLLMGPQGVAFQYLMAKVIPVNRRGTLNALRSMTGGAIAAILSYFAGSWFIESNVLGNGYSTTFLAAFVLTSFGLASISIMKEPIAPSVRPPGRVRDRIKQLPALLRSDRGFMFFFIARSCSVMGMVAAPFYILYASSKIELNGTNLGLLTVAFLSADTITNLIWGFMADRSGFRLVYLSSMVLWVGGTVILLMSSSIAGMMIAFIALGAAMGGHMISSQNMVLEFGNRDDLPMRIALSNTAQNAVMGIGPLFAGLLAAHLGYVPLFVIAGLFSIAAFAIVIFMVPEPRHVTT